MMAIQLIPPLNEPPINPATGDHHQAWIAHHQEVADELQSPTGTTSGDDAAVGKIGEYRSIIGASVGLTSNAALDTTSLSLPAGDWDVSGVIAFAAAVATHATQIGAAISTTSATLGVQSTLVGASFNVGAALRLSPPAGVRVNVSVTTPVYLVALATFTGGTLTATGALWARRMR